MDIDKRKATHLGSIYGTLSEKKIPRRRKKEPHISFIMAIKEKGLACWQMTKQYVESRIDFSVIDIVDTLEEAMVMEAQLLNKHFDNVKNVNSSRYSCHPYKNILK